MSIKQQIQTDLTTAMKAGEKLKVDVLRMLRAKIQEMELQLRGEQGKEVSLDDDQVLQAITRYAKQLRESVEGFEKGGRTEQADQTRRELELVETFLPAQLTDEELNKLVAEAIAEVGASSPKDMGKVMKPAMSRVQGRADGKRVSAAVKALLTHS
jgi:uncharacterized protein YqeY